MFTTPGPIQRPKTSTPADEVSSSCPEFLMLEFLVFLASRFPIPTSLYSRHPRGSRLHAPRPSANNVATSTPSSTQVNFKYFIRRSHTHALSTLPAVPRTIQARLHDAEFVSICDGRGHLPVDVDPAETVSVNPDNELQDELQSNQITIQFMAISQRPRVYTHSNQNQYELRLILIN